MRSIIVLGLLAGMALTLSGCEHLIPVYAFSSVPHYTGE